MAAAAWEKNAWCPGQCPLSTEYGPLLEHMRRSALGQRYIPWSGWQPWKQEEPPCNLCQHRWLFIVSIGGRTGSTTLQDMLNAHPRFRLAGENTNALASALELWMKAANQIYHIRSWARYPPHPAHLLCDLQQWFLDISIPRGSDPTGAKIVGFKEIRWTQSPGIPVHAAQQLQPHGNGEDDPTLLVRFAAMLFPCSRFIFNYRNSTEQARSQGSTFVHANTRGNHSELERQRAAFASLPWQKWRTRSIALEDFSPMAFNQLLRWMGEKKCLFRRVMHSNQQRYSMRDIKPETLAERLLIGNCSLV